MIICIILTLLEKIFILTLSRMTLLKVYEQIDILNDNICTYYVVGNCFVLISIQIYYSIQCYNFFIMALHKQLIKYADHTIYVRNYTSSTIYYCSQTSVSSSYTIETRLRKEGATHSLKKPAESSRKPPWRPLLPRARLARTRLSSSLGRRRHSSAYQAYLRMLQQYNHYYYTTTYSNALHGQRGTSL